MALTCRFTYQAVTSNPSLSPAVSGLSERIVATEFDTWHMDWLANSDR
jgi:hypothetical protein